MTMKTIGLWGGTTWHSTMEYYRQINEEIAARLGPQHSARVIVHSVDFNEISTAARDDDWPAVIALGQRVVRSLEAAGADCILFGANTLHRFAPSILPVTRLPFVDIVECTVEAIRARGIDAVALLGTRLTMQDDFFRGRLERAGIRALVPREDQVGVLHRIIVEELSAGRFTDEFRNEFLGALRELVAAGAKGVVLGCTELPILFRGVALPVPAFDTLRLHVLKAVDFALG
jgi:aspartate racemase